MSLRDYLLRRVRHVSGEFTLSGMVASPDVDVRGDLAGSPILRMLSIAPTDEDEEVRDGRG